MKIFDRIVNWWRNYPRIADGLIMLPLLGLILLSSQDSMTSSTFPLYMYDWPDWTLRAIVVTIYVLHMVPWIFRRTNPIGSAAVVVVGSLVHLVFGPDMLTSMIMVVLTVQNLAHLAPMWASIAGFVTAVVGALLYAAKATMVPKFWGTGAYSEGEIQEPTGMAYTLPISIPVIAMVVLFWAIGNIQRTRRVRLETLQTRAEQLRVEARQERELAAADERNRIARELHDIVAHSLQVVISQADGGRYAARTDPDVAPRTLETIADTGRDALDQMRRLLGVLRETDATNTAPQPGLADVDELIDTMRLSGLDVHLHHTGEPKDVPDGAELVLYRIIQEALTNVSRHVGATASASVTLHWRNTGVSVTIDDDGDNDDDGENDDGDDGVDHGGQGLIGMRERVELYDGTFAAGPKVGGGFRVHAHLPYRTR